MPEHEARVRAFYDHEAEEAPSGRRRRQVADWGVGEDVFDRMPSRRFSRAEHGHGHGRVAAEPAAAESEAAPADASAVPAAAAPARSPRPAADRPVRRRPAGRAVPRGGADDGRRTIVIGAPREDYAAAAPPRPPRLAHERVGPRPDRIVAYAVGLGFLLILIAILSAGH